MPKYFTYDLRSRVRVNQNAKHGMPDAVGREGEVLEHLDSWQYDYKVLLDNGVLGVFKEFELNLIRGDVNV